MWQQCDWKETASTGEEFSPRVGVEVDWTLHSMYNSVSFFRKPRLWVNRRIYGGVLPLIPKQTSTWYPKKYFALRFTKAVKVCYKINLATTVSASNKVFVFLGLCWFQQNKCIISNRGIILIPCYRYTESIRELSSEKCHNCLIFEAIVIFVLSIKYTANLTQIYD
jgi:hypothetical protein